MIKMRMNLQYFAGEKTEKATPRKKRETREKGQVAKTNELPSALIFLFMFIMFFMIGPYITESLINFYYKIFNQYLTWEITPDNIRLLFLQLTYDTIWILLPIFGIAILGGIAGNLVQFGFLISGEPLKIKLERLNPLEGAKRIFSKRAIVELLKSLLKIILIGYLSFSTLWDEKENILTLFHYELPEIMIFVGKLVLEIGIKTSILLIILAMFDYTYQKFDYEKQLRMSKQDIKDEYKKTEGDPLIKGKIKERQRQMAMRRMMQSVPQADVIITNPTHYAVAIVYKAGEMEAPLVLAKGLDNIALKIKEVAKENNITLVENKWLARTLYHQVEIGDPIPADLYQAIAEVLAYVYNLQKNKATS